MDDSPDAADQRQLQLKRAGSLGIFLQGMILTSMVFYGYSSSSNEEAASRKGEHDSRFGDLRKYTECLDLQTLSGVPRISTALACPRNFAKLQLVAPRSNIARKS